MRKNSFAIAMATAIMTVLVLADRVAAQGPMDFEPIAASAYAALTTDAAVLAQQPWLVPPGFTQTIVSDESRLDIYAGADWPDMNTVNETGAQAGRYLYRTHEVRPRGRLRSFTGAAVSVVDLHTGEAKVIAQRRDWEAIDGIVWTPWGSLLLTEEADRALLADPRVAAVRGLVYEMTLDKADPTKADRIEARARLGSLAHEGIEVDANGHVYVIDEHRAGAIYKFVPARYGDLRHGRLYALEVNDATAGDGTGPARWVALDMRLAQTDARAAAARIGATRYDRPEDLERIGDVLYVAITGEDRVLSIRLGDEPFVRNFVKAGLNAPVENRRAGVTGFKNPDNLATGPGDQLWIAEDNTPSDIWVAAPDKDGNGASDGVRLFASLRDVDAEGTGIYFGRDPHTLYVNIQHSSTGNDKTMAISKK